jgi:hypothetical protein
MKIKKLYLDMDGVIANFEKRYIELFKEPPGGLNRDRKEFSKNWEVFIQDKHFETLDWWPGACELISYIQKNFSHDTVEILTSSGGNKYHSEVEVQKNIWIKKMNLSEQWKVNVVAGRKLKAEFATPDSVLIDDTLDVIEAFNKAGGIGIHHKDYGNTIMLLDILLAND